MLRLSTFAADVLSALSAAASAAVGGPLTINDQTGGLSSVVVNAPGASGGANVKLAGNGATTPNKTIRAYGGLLQIINSAYSAAILTLTDAGGMTLAGPIGISGTSGPTWTSGTGAPTGTQPNGSIYSRSDGTLGNRLYVSTGSAWNPVMSV